MAERSNRLFPNRGGSDPPVSRRRLLAGSAAVGAAATAGCRGDDAAGTASPGLVEAPTVLVFNTGDRTVSVIDADDVEVVETTPVGLTSSFPSNQYAPDVVDSDAGSFWVNVDRGVRALAAADLTERTHVETGSGFNWQELTPDGSTLVVSAREPAHAQFRVDADPESDDFGRVVDELDRADEGGRGDNEGPGPCDVTIHPEEPYAYVPDLYGGTVTVLDLASFEIARQVEVEPVDSSTPWMATVAPGGERMLVEHRSGTETVWDLSDPAAPAEVARLTAADGLGEGPLTSEIAADGVTGFVFTPGSEAVSVVDLAAGDVVDRIDLGGRAFAGTWDPDRERLYVPVQTANEVQVIDPDSLAVTATLDAGASPYGATAARVRPDPEPATAEAALGALGLLPTGTTYCIGNCACGHDH